MNARIERQDARAALDKIVPLAGGRLGFHGWVWRSEPGPLAAVFAADGEPAELEAVCAVRRTDLLHGLDRADLPQSGLTTFFAICRTGRDGALTGSVELPAEPAAALRLERPVDPDGRALLGILETVADGWESPGLLRLLLDGEGEIGGALIRRLGERNRLPAAEALARRLLQDLPQTASAARTIYAALVFAALTWVQRANPSDVDPQTRARLGDLADLGAARGWLAPQQAADLLGALHYLGMAAEALEIGRRLLASGEADRRALFRGLLHITPADTRSILAAALGQEAATGESTSALLNALGGALSASHRAWEAELMFGAAARVDPNNATARLNAGWSALERGDAGAAADAFQAVVRSHPTLSSAALWPQVQGAPWPRSSQEAAIYAGLEPPGGWPRISLVTPSFNQAAFVEETLLSILNQDYPNLQYIVVDGVSSDGSVEILERYRDRLDHLVIEPDEGQSDAINKGFRLADGELLGWLNSDDMLAPGALHVMAAAWCGNRPDLLAGLCVEHTDRALKRISRPGELSTIFTPDALADLFGHWIKGDYFIQPEVLFTRQALERAGELDPSLHYAMDYDLWLRMALAGCKAEVVPWPAAFFRKHAAQKTASYADSLEEQARIRTARRPLQMDPAAAEVIGARFTALASVERPRVAVISARRDAIFSSDTARELSERLGERADVAFVQSAAEAPAQEADLCVHLVHLQNDVASIESLRAARPERPVIGWFWDSHHHSLLNHRVAEAVDIAIPAHGAYSEYLRSRSSLLDPTLPLCVTQWTRAQATKWFAEVGERPRSPQLFGAYVRYPFAAERNAFLEACLGGLPDQALTLAPDRELSPYYGLTENARFAEWSRHKASLVAPVHNDLSQRVFDALLTGQVPLVPRELTALDAVIPPDLQQTLPIVRFSMKDVGAVERAHDEAVRAFDRDGPEGARRRHDFVLHGHMFADRMAELLGRVADWA